jgi:hypothetical protein
VLRSRGSMGPTLHRARDLTPLDAGAAEQETAREDRTSSGGSSSGLFTASGRPYGGDIRETSPARAARRSHGASNRTWHRPSKARGRGARTPGVAVSQGPWAAFKKLSIRGAGSTERRCGIERKLRLASTKTQAWLGVRSARSNSDYSFGRGPDARRRHLKGYAGQRGQHAGSTRF